MSNLHAIITGGSSGIGKALAQQLAQQGYHLSLIARDPAKLSSAAKEVALCCQNPQQKILTFSADVVDGEGVQKVVEQAIEALGPVQLLITSAGIAVPGYFSELPMENFVQAMQVNFLGSVHAIKAALPSLSKTKGRIVIISSGAGLTGVFGYTSYGASKFALRGFAEALRSELKPQGVAVSIVYPPDTDTPQLHAENKIKPLETKSISGGGKVMTAEAVAKAIIKGIKKSKFAIAPNFEMQLLVWVNSIAAPLLYRYFDYIIRKTQKASLKIVNNDAMD